MFRYFLEISYRGTRYSGFQVQDNSGTIQYEVEKAFNTVQRSDVHLTGSSRTDTGVHAFQNFFHFDYEEDIHPQIIYKLNAILPPDIAVRNIYKMHPEAHCRFDAVSREYEYRIHRYKDPFLEGRSFYFPYKLDLIIMKEAAAFVKEQTDFFAFSKTNTQVKNFNSIVIKSQWIIEEDRLVYNIEANRFLRGMVRLLTASLLKLGRARMEMDRFKDLFGSKEKCGFSIPPQGLFLRSVRYPANYFPAPGLGFTGLGNTFS